MRLLLLPAFFMQRGGKGESRPVRPAYLYYLYSYPAAMYGIEEGKCSSPSFSPFSSALPPLSGAKEGGEGRAVMSPIEKRVEGGRKRHLVKEGGGGVLTGRRKKRGGMKQLPSIPSRPSPNGLNC